ncbi:hypothetical protein [Prescottella subtropica]|uniref:hypothetical protein n=1 Tax=Prescottella subtropica TaxID=2545757 RepID=UPI0010F56DD4|nr:hypothetical protein [Prescottella subtropica]
MSGIVRRPAVRTALLPLAVIAAAVAATGCSALDRTESGVAVGVSGAETTTATASISESAAAATPTTREPDPLSKPPLPGESCGTTAYPQTGSVVDIFVEKGTTITCAGAYAVFGRYLHDPALEHGGNTWFASFDGWGCSSPTAARAQATGNSGVCETADGQLRIVARPAAGPVPGVPATVAGDLGLSTPMTVPACDGTGIVVLANATDPASYRTEIQRYLTTYPGASYLRTDRSCPSLRQASDSGDPIYTVYREAGRTTSEVCAAVRAAGGDAYGKRLDGTSDPSTWITC